MVIVGGCMNRSERATTTMTLAEAKKRNLRQYLGFLCQNLSLGPSAFLLFGPYPCWKDQIQQGFRRLVLNEMRWGGSGRNFDLEK